MEAIGIMANMFFESGFNPEAVGDNGTSFGLVQQHGSYGYLVSGNQTQDMKNQITLLKQNGGFQAASGSTPAAAAGNFAANYERCVGCQAGGSQHSSRSAYAATVAGWVKSGNWPTSAGTAPSGSGGGSGGGQQTQTTSFDWTFGIPIPGFGWAGRIIEGAVGSYSSIGDVAKALAGIVTSLNKITQLFLMLFRPDFWLRVGAFLFGFLALGAGLYFLKESLTS
jgi:hypothetical protein